MQIFVTAISSEKYHFVFLCQSLLQNPAFCECELHFLLPLGKNCKSLSTPQSLHFHKEVGVPLEQIHAHEILQESPLQSKNNQIVHQNDS